MLEPPLHLRQPILISNQFKSLEEPRETQREQDGSSKKWRGRGGDGCFLQQWSFGIELSKEPSWDDGPPLLQWDWVFELPASPYLY